MGVLTSFFFKVAVVCLGTSDGTCIKTETWILEYSQGVKVCIGDDYLYIFTDFSHPALSDSYEMPDDYIIPDE